MPTYLLVQDVLQVFQRRSYGRGPGVDVRSRVGVLMFCLVSRWVDRSGVLDRYSYLYRTYFMSPARQ